MLAFLKCVLCFWLIAAGSNAYTQQPRLMLPVGHLGEVEGAFSPDGKKILTTGDDGTAKLWDIYTGHMLADLVGHKGEVTIAKFTPDGQKIITAADDNIAKIWSAVSGQLLHTLDANKGSILSFEFPLSGNRIIIYYEADGIKVTTVWNISSGKLLASIDESLIIQGDRGLYLTSPVVSFSPTGKHIARTGVHGFNSDSMIIVATDVLSGKKNTMEGSIPHISSIRFSEDGKILLVLGNRYLWDTVSSESVLKREELIKIIALWDVVTGKLLKKFELTRPMGYDSEIKLSGDCRTLVIRFGYQKDGRYKTAIQVWNVLAGKLSYSFDEHNEDVKFLFGPSDKTLVIIGDDNTVNIRDLASGKLLNNLVGTKGKRLSYELGKNTSTIAIRDGKTVNLWDVLTGKWIHSLQHTQEIEACQFGAKGKTFITITEDNTIHQWDIGTGKLLRSVNCGDSMVISIDESSDGNYFATLTEPLDDKKKEEVRQTVGIWQWVSGQLLWSHTPTNPVDSIQFGPDGKSVAIYFDTKDLDVEDNIQIWETQTGKMKLNFKGNASYVRAAVFSPDEKRIITSYKDSTVKIWEVKSGQFLSALHGHTAVVNAVQYSSNGKYIITGSDDSTARIWDAATGGFLLTLSPHEGPVYSVQFSGNGQYIVTASKNNARIWDAGTGKLTRILSGGGGYDARFSPDARYLVVNGIVWDMASGERIFELDWHNSTILSNQFSTDGKYIVTASADRTAKVWSMEYGELLYSLEGHRDDVVYAAFSEDSKTIITASLDNTVKTWNTQTGKLEKSLDLGPNTEVKDIPVKGDKLLCIKAGSETKIIDFPAGERIYSFLAVDTGDYLVVDKYNRYDGTENARKLLYFVCNDEIIELDQVKDQLWSPGLAERIIKGDTINSPKLSDLRICGHTPELRESGIKNNAYHFKIIPRRGGLGETAVYINGIEIKRYAKSQLKSNAGSYDLVIPRREVLPYFIAGQENPISVKSWIADNTISSRGVIVRSQKTKDTAAAPDLYAVFVGISDYKGEGLDLKYAAKDAGDIAVALSAAARKLLNTDGKEHVFTYHLTTTDTRYRLPEKNGIRKTLEEIGKNATANDILLLFFAGHGIMEGKNKKEFYFLTADASRSSAIDAIADIGISMAELTEWVKPAHIKAQKRIMIFDACNSGQAIRDFVQLGKPDQRYIAARNDEKGQQIKAIEKLNNQSGLIILAASASDQNAYEMGRYSQGLLTYSLLRVMKQQPEILENGKYLDVTNWLNAAKKMVAQLSEGTGARQDPQLNTNNNFNIGIVDEEVRNKIILSAEKPLFTRSNFQNMESKLDNLKLRSAIDKELINISSRGYTADISYSAEYEGADAFTLTGDYKIAGDDITVTILLVKGGTEVKHRYEVKGKVADINGLVNEITGTSLNWLKSNK